MAPRKTTNQLGSKKKPMTIKQFLRKAYSKKRFSLNEIYDDLCCWYNPDDNVAKTFVMDGKTIRLPTVNEFIIDAFEQTLLEWKDAKGPVFYHYHFPAPDDGDEYVDLTAIWVHRDLATDDERERFLIWDRDQLALIQSRNLWLERQAAERHRDADHLREDAIKRAGPNVTPFRPRRRSDR